MTTSATSSDSPPPALVAAPALSEPLAGPAKALHLPGLDSLRGMAALLVLIHHLEGYKHAHRLPSLLSSTFHAPVDAIGQNAVRLFLVLSGFLITYLLQNEIERHGRVDVKRFWMRRILRTWPVYFVTIGLAFGVLPLFLHLPGIATTRYGRIVLEVSRNPVVPLLWYLAILPNVAIRKFPVAITGASHTWSVGVEEQFYLVWPLLMGYVRRGLWVLLPLLAFKPLLIDVLAPAESLNEWRRVGMLTPFEFMAIGSMAALLFRHWHPTTFRRGTGQTALAGLVLAGMVGSLFVTLPVLVHGAFNAAGVVAAIFFFGRFREPRLLRSAGHVSYGIYMYHPFVMFVCLTVLGLLRLSATPLGVAVQYSVVIAGTWLVARLSMQLIEAPCLRWKSKFQR